MSFIKKQINDSDLREAYQRAEPFPYFVVDNFLEEKFARSLLQEFPSFAEKFAIAEHGRVGGKAVREDMRNLAEPFRELDRYFSSREFLDWMSRITGIPDLIYDPDYIGGGTHENLPGQDLSVHIDFNYHPTRGWHRRINALLYLNPEWEENWGGALELWREPWSAPSKNKIAKIAPLWNRLAVFPTTESSWHGFETVRAPQGKSRKSIALYLYTKERPPAETGSMHSTVYYERPLPESIQAGKILSQADYDELMRLTVRRDELLKFLYHREKQFSNTIESVNKNLRVQENWIQARIASGKIDEPLPEPLKDAGLILLGSPRKAQAGDWVLAQIHEFRCPQLLYLDSEMGGLYLAGQLDHAESMLISPATIRAVVKFAQSDSGEMVQLPKSVPVSLRGRSLAMLFVLLHSIKNRLLGRIKSPFLWKLSQRYRSILHRLGIQVPLITPPKR
jgi:Rps23 Pro-64 3,4-dihydroxylase Tpa1-like proline 4-hydroxylase